MAIKDISDFALFYSPGQYDARLSLSPTAAITVPDIFASTQIYLVPFRGNLFSLWDLQDLTWRAVQFTLVTIPVPFTTNLQFDLYAYLNPDRASISVETVDWLNDTTRAVPLALFQGAVVKSGNITRKYIGTGRTTGVAGQTEDSRANRLLRNYANYVRRIITLAPGYVNANTTTSILVTNTAWAEVNGGSTVRYLANSESPVDVSLSFSAEAPLANTMQIGLGDTSITTAHCAVTLDKKAISGGCLRFGPQKLPGSYTISILARVDGGIGKLYTGLPFNGGVSSPCALSLDGAIYG